MPPPFLPAPVSTTVDGNISVQPQDMVAVRTLNTCFIDITFPNGSIVKKEVAAGSLGFLIQHSGAECRIQIFNTKSGNRALCMYFL
jgi:hypothetical protein